MPKSPEEHKHWLNYPAQKGAQDSGSGCAALATALARSEMDLPESGIKPAKPTVFHVLSCLFAAPVLYKTNSLTSEGLFSFHS